MSRADNDRQVWSAATRLHAALTTLQHAVTGPNSNSVHAFRQLTHHQAFESSPSVSASSIDGPSSDDTDTVMHAHNDCIPPSPSVALPIASSSSSLSSPSSSSSLSSGIVPPAPASRRIYFDPSRQPSKALGIYAIESYAHLSQLLIKMFLSSNNSARIVQLDDAGKWLLGGPLVRPGETESKALSVWECKNTNETVSEKRWRRIEKDRKNESRMRSVLMFPLSINYFSPSARVRRLYEICQVFVALGMIQKIRITQVTDK